MTKDQIRKGNIIIGEFMQWKVCYTGFEWCIPSFLHDEMGESMRYHKDWNWLMEACKKWDTILFVTTIEPREYSELCDKLDHYVTLYDIEPVWKQLVANIKWYNKQTKKK